MVFKKGLSQVVTSVILILIVLAAVVIIWSFVRPTIKGAGEQISADCFSIDLEVVSCVQGAVNSEVRVKRNAGAGSLSGFSLIFEDGSVSRNDTALSELETKNFDAGGNYSGQTVDVAALVGDNQRVCNPINRPVLCE